MTRDMLRHAMKAIGKTTTWESAAAMPAVDACLHGYSRQGQPSSIGRTPFARHRARSLLCGS